jgi:hypothetical protein
VAVALSGLAWVFADADAGTVLVQELAGTAAWLVAGLHFAYLLYAVFGGFLGLIGNRWLLAHLISSAWSITVTATAITCPMTRVEKWLIGQSGGVPYDGTFIDYYLEGPVYPVGYDAHVWYAGAVVVVSVYALIILRRLRAKPPVTDLRPA